MNCLYVIEHGVFLGVDGGRIVVKKEGNELDSYPIETLESILVFSSAQISTQCLIECMKRDIRVSYFSSSGYYYGGTSAQISKEAERIKEQIKFCSDKSICLEMSRIVISAKINNQIVVARRFIKDNSDDYTEIRISKMKQCRKRVQYVNDKGGIRGCEGIAARYYFEIISHLIDKEYSFNCRNRRPAKDPVNAMLNFGYSVLYNLLCGVIDNCGLISSIGFWHEDKKSHKSLASDLMEEWRAPIVDTVVWNIVMRKNVTLDMFSCVNGKCVMNSDVKRVLIGKLVDKINEHSKYLDYINKDVSFREAIWHQVNRFKNSIINETLEYKAIRVR